jgi:hypothetical protein
MGCGDINAVELKQKRHWELQYLGFRTVGNMYAKTEEGPTHAYLLLKLTMN